VSILSTTQPIGQRLTIGTENAGPIDIVLAADVGTPGAQPAPIAGVDDGGAAEAGTGGLAGLLTYVKGTASQQSFRWNGTRWAGQIDLVPNILFVFPGLAVDASPFFGTVQAAINSLAGGFGVIIVPPLTNITENIVIPATGGMEIQCSDPAFLCTITGTWTDAGGAGGRTLVLSNIACTGSFNFTNSGTFTSLQLFNSSVSGDISIGTQLLYAWGLRPGKSVSANYTTTYDSSINLNGNITCSQANINAVSLLGNAKTYALGFGSLRNCFVGGTAPTFTGTIALLGTPLRNAATFSGAVRADDFSAGFILSKGSTVAGGLTLLNQGFSKGPTAFAANVAPTNMLTVKPPAGLYRVDASVQLTTLATLGPTATFNVGSTDESGAFTLPVFTFDAAAASRAQGSLPFRTNNAAQVTFSIQGITTPGLLAAQYSWTLTPLNSQTV